MTAARLFWSLRSHWYSGSLRAWAVVVLLTVSALACVLAGLWYRSAQREEVVMQEQLDGAKRKALPVAAAAASPPRDFTADLGPAQPAERLVEVIQSAAARAGVTLTSVQVQEQLASPERLGRTELPLVLIGPYPSVKRCLAEILDRIPRATVARLQWQRAEGTVDTEARVQLVVWSAPAMAGAALATRP